MKSDMCREELEFALAWYESNKDNYASDPSSIIDYCEIIKDLKRKIKEIDDEENKEIINMKLIGDTEIRDYALYELTTSLQDPYTREKVVTRRLVGVLTDITAAKAMNVVTELMAHNTDKSISYSIELIGG